MSNELQSPAEAPLMRLQKFLARAGVASRRHSEEIIAAGRVCVNGVARCDLGCKIDPIRDEVCLDGKRISLPQERVVLMLNKPASYLTSMSDPHGRACVCDLIDTNRYPGIFPLGRLDYDTEGLLLFTNDGSLAQEIMHPKHEIGKLYRAVVSGRVKPSLVKYFEEGIKLEDGNTAPARLVIARSGTERFVHADAPLKYTEDQEESNTSELLICIHEGKKRQIKRMCLACGHEVLYLERLQIGALCLGGLARSAYRELKSEEINSLFEPVRMKM